MINKEQELCVSCGFCCDGTLFLTANSKDVNELLHEMKSVERKGKHCGFELPCKYFDKLCTVYDQKRPKICGAFKCKLLKNAIDGEVSYEYAHSLIQKVKQQQKRLWTLIPNSRGHVSLKKAWQSFAETNEEHWDSKAFKKQNGALLMEWAIYQKRLREFYIKRKIKKDTKI